MSKINEEDAKNMELCDCKKTCNEMRKVGLRKVTILLKATDSTEEVMDILDEVSFLLKNFYY